MQTSFFGFSAPDCDAAFRNVHRTDLGDGAWIDVRPAWITGHQHVFDALRDGLSWRASRREMYGREVDVPRLLARLPDDGEGHPVLTEAALALSARYGLRLHSLSAALYRDGHDSVAWHGDRMGPLIHDTIVAVVSLGASRRFQLRPTRGGRAITLVLGQGDLLVMGGTCQATWQHCVPKMRSAGPRISVMFRPEVPQAQPGRDAR